MILRSSAIAALIVLACTSAPTLAAETGAAGGCGTIVLFDKSLKKDGIYGVGMITLDGKAPLRRKYDHTVSAGTHQLMLGELIPMGELSHAVQRSRDRSIRNRELTLEVKADERYVIAAKLNKEQKDDINAYWTPVVIKDEPQPCKPD
jgi:hypothetical protein